MRNYKRKSPFNAVKKSVIKKLETHLKEVEKLRNESDNGKEGDSL